MTEFNPFPKIPRLEREVVITEKIDGTNASIQIHFTDRPQDVQHLNEAIFVPQGGGRVAVLLAGSRTRFISPGKTTDNFGFAAWVWENREELVSLGEGTHYGEWWGKGIQRGYDLDHKRFSLFDVHRWINPHWPVSNPRVDATSPPACCHVVPVLFSGRLFEDHYDGLFYAPDVTLAHLREFGSEAAPGFMKPEGIMVYHTAARQMFKRTFEHDENGKEAA